MNFTVLKMIPQKTKTGFSSFEQFSSFVVNNPKSISPQLFSEEFGKIQKTYMKNRKHDDFCASADELADKLTFTNGDFAGIIMSSLCKLVQFYPEKLEPLAKRGYAIAKQNGDCIHMMARLNDLRKIYYRNPAKLREYLNVLFKQEECLKQLCSNYEGAVNSYRTVSRTATDKRDYVQMLAHVQTEIGKLTKRKHPEEAQARLLEAREIFSQRGNQQHVDYIDMLLSEIDEALFKAVI